MAEKKKVVVWGTGRRTAMYRKWLEENYKIVAYVSTNSIKGAIYGAKVVDPTEMESLDMDYILLTVEVADIESAKQQIAGLGKVYADKCVTINELDSQTAESDYLEFTNKRQLKVIKEILSATDKEISDYDWMYSRVIEYGLFCFDEEHWHEADEKLNWAVYGLQQVPEEFAQFCCRLSVLKIQTAAEVGVYRGRSAFFICSILARKNVNLKYKMIDIANRIDDYELFKSVLPQLELCIPATSDDYRNEKFDFVFIDADHSYDASIKDYENMGIAAKVLVGFHDIYAHEYDDENGGAVRTWNEVLERTKDRKHWIFSKYPDQWMGIGCVLM
ncbi:Methyltransferase domain [Pseudobutyrivibrio sp. YE44]|uniref:class I SAM-dependent methyltransferase n=1 Tax=Pseudobutyrivibrio sp. YE44 TaxID=1520802 RepID=UPI000888285C|nr:class I SAM-dependent methyltransferase [Pseudobutyrivibrio sp. YE44]SDB29099.1 Methyltransferase domain [Pseudobutyrivibrio sp. YE44]